MWKKLWFPLPLTPGVVCLTIFSFPHWTAGRNIWGAVRFNATSVLTAVAFAVNANRCIASPHRLIGGRKASWQFLSNLMDSRSFCETWSSRYLILRVREPVRTEWHRVAAILSDIVSAHGTIGSVFRKARTCCCYPSWCKLCTVCINEKQPVKFPV